MKFPSISGATKAWKREDRLERWSGNISKHSGRFVYSLLPQIFMIGSFDPQFVQKQYRINSYRITRATFHMLVMVIYVYL
jgi:hypothetical protein